MTKPKIYISNYAKYNDDPEIDYDPNEVELEEALEIMTDEWIRNDNTAWKTIIDLRDAVKYFINKYDTTR